MVSCGVTFSNTFPFIFNLTECTYCQFLLNFVLTIFLNFKLFYTDRNVHRAFLPLSISVTPSEALV